MNHTRYFLSSVVVLSLTLGLTSPSYSLFGFADSKAKLKALYEMQEALDKLQAMTEKGNTKVNNAQESKEFAQHTQKIAADFENVLKVAQEEIQAPAQAEIEQLQQKMKEKGAKVKELEDLIKYNRGNLSLFSDLKKIIVNLKKIVTKEVSAVEVLKSAVWDTSLDTQINQIKLEIDDFEKQLQESLKVHRQLLSSNPFYSQNVKAGSSNKEMQISEVIKDIAKWKGAFHQYAQEFKKMKASLNSLAARGEEQMKLIDRLVKSAGCSLIKNRSQATSTNMRACMLNELKKKKPDILKKDQTCSSTVLNLQELNADSQKRTLFKSNPSQSLFNEKASFYNIADCAASLLGKPLLARPKEPIKPKLLSQ